MARFTFFAIALSGLAANLGALLLPGLLLRFAR
jgi:hypothetical protein